ncbi:Zinc finger BED domain-containing protein 1 [Liparis tanakae]|uniref:Zinc finger BED domain-containing protein 1 n=1 Tax=Liparis tanakae TaxID=230148 RepID=A0A4Z2GH43_9TELE|nr:Zinc finger BED domain-containing protein 1 [Liparis tanakae]
MRHMEAISHLPCAAHSLQRTITVALKDSGFENVLAKCRKIVGHFKHSPSNDRELKAQQTAEGQQEESLVQDVATRWNSALDMIKRIQRNKGPLAATLAQRKTNISMLTAPELAKLEKLEQLLEPCRQGWHEGVADKPPGLRPQSRSPPVPVIPFKPHHPGNPFATKPQQPGNPPGYRTAYHPGNPEAPKLQKPGNPSVNHPGNPFATKP